MDEKKHMSAVSHFIRGILALLIAFSLPGLTGCVPFKQARVAAVALTIQDVGQAAAKQGDLTIIREGTPAYLMLLDGLIEAYPKNRELLIAACQAYGSYASSFFADEDREKAQALYRKAKLYGFRGLSGRRDFGAAASGSLDEFLPILQQFKKSDVPALFWAANAWASWISSDIGGVETMADLPALEAVMKRILELDDTFYYGGPHLLMGIYLAAKPSSLGGDMGKAKEHFERAFSLGGGKILMSKVFYAQYYARGINDRDLFVRTLQEVRASGADEVPEFTFANTVAREKAGRLLEKVDEYFGSKF